ncbi:hypothetical protein DL771_010353 [Monosporascus sp. 5C6A]|nr:hypothetical protein DL771_010353 [Monosporascus sp. 5C6A]
MVLSLGTKIIIVSVVFSILPIVAVLLRFRARAIRAAGFLADDYLIVPGLIFSVGLSVTQIVAVVKGNLGGHIHLDEHGAIVFDDTLTAFLQTEWASQLLSVLSLVFTKTSVVLFYRRIFRGMAFSLISWALLGAIMIWGIAFFFATLFECMPIEYVWKSIFGTPEHEAHCYYYIPMFIATAVTNMIVDAAILALPIPFVWHLNMPTRQKLAISGLFLLGAFVVGISITRIYFFYVSTDSYANALDITFNIAPTLYWTQLEASIAVVSACLPTLRPLFSRFSLETLVYSLASKLSIHNGTKSSGGSAPSRTGEWGQSLPNPSVSSAARIVNRCEAVRLSSFEDPPIELREQSGIIVQKMIHQSEHERPA